MESKAMDLYPPHSVALASHANCSKDGRLRELLSAFEQQVPAFAPVPSSCLPRVVPPYYPHTTHPAGSALMGEHLQPATMFNKQGLQLLSPRPDSQAGFVQSCLSAELYMGREEQLCSSPRSVLSFASPQFVSGTQHYALPITEGAACLDSSKNAKGDRFLPRWHSE